MYKPRQKILFLMGWYCGRTVGELASYILLEIRIVLARKLISMNDIALKMYALLDYGI